MPAYKFEAINTEGKTFNGLLDADNIKAARSQLRAQALVPVAVTPVSSARGLEGGVTFKRRVFSATGLAVWTRQIAGLVSSGLPLERALTALSEEASSNPERELLAHLRAEVNSGASFAQALSSAPQEFDEVYCGVVAAGEQSGALGLVLERLADDLEERQTLRSQLIAASLYPAIVSVIALLIVIFLVTYVVPQVASVFSSSKRALPLLTVIMLNLSSFLKNHGWVLLLGIVSGALGLMLMQRNLAFRTRFDAAWLQVPLLGRLSRGYNAARFCGTLAMLAGAGVPILKAVQAASETLSNRAMRADALEALDQVREGAPLASAFAGKKRFPGLLAMFARLGEQTGKLPSMLDRAAQQLSTEVQRRALQLATILEPLLIVGMGVMVLLIVLAVLLPIIQMNTWVK